jgi:hypothetical protein
VGVGDAAAQDVRRHDEVGDALALLQARAQSTNRACGSPSSSWRSLDGSKSGDTGRGEVPFGMTRTREAGTRKRSA